MPTLRKIRFLLLPVTVLGAVFAYPDAGRSAPRGNTACIAEKDSCVPATETLRFAGKVAAPSTAENVFGISVQIAGDLLAVGTPWDSEKGYRAGAVYLYRATGRDWQQIAKLTPKTPVAKAMFGSSLDLKGERLIVGAPGEKEGKLISAGAVYVFEQTPDNRWAEQARIVPNSILAGDFFGTSVAALPNEIMVGAHLEDGKGIDSGAVYVFSRDTSGKWQQQQKLQPETLKPGTLFGNALATNGRQLVVGAYGYDGSSPGGGAVYVYHRGPHGSWEFSQILQPDQRKAFAEFGWTLALNENHLLVGAPYEDESVRQTGAAYLFKWDVSRSRWIIDTKLRYRDPKWQERFGASVALAGDRAIVGAPYGIAYVFAPAPDGKGWQQSLKLVGNTPAADNLFSRTVASDGRMIALGVPLQDETGKGTRAGAAYLFEWIPPATEAQ